MFGLSVRHLLAQGITFVVCALWTLAGCRNRVAEGV
jgi:hypothetical protein